MRRHQLLTLMLLITLAVFAVGCRTTPIYSVSDAPITSSKTPTQAQVKKAIMHAGASLGWQMREESRGHITGTLKLRKHTAVVDIPYTAKSYSINYKDSTELGYDGSNIHKNYNGWVQNLDKRITMELNSL